MERKHPNRLLLEELIIKDLKEMPDSQFIVIEKMLNDLKQLRKEIASRGDGPGDIGWNGSHSIKREADQIIALHEKGRQVDGHDVLGHSCNIIAYAALMAETMITQVDFGNHPKFEAAETAMLAALSVKAGEA